MAKRSAGILLSRTRQEKTEVLLVHPGGPFWQQKDLGTWSIPKGEYGDDEDPLGAAKREMEEEIGKKAEGEFIPLGHVKLKSGKMIHAWACEGDFDPDNLESNSFEMEWPPKSGQLKSFPEVDKAGWFDFAKAEEKINSGQIPLLRELEKIILSKKLL